MGPKRVLPAAPDAHGIGCSRPADGAENAFSCLERTLRPPRPHRTLDFSSLDVCFSDRCDRVSDAVSVMKTRDGFRLIVRSSMSQGVERGLKPATTYSIQDAAAACSVYFKL